MPSQWLPSPHEVPPLLVDNEKLSHLGTGLPTCYNSSAAEASGTLAGPEWLTHFILRSTICWQFGTTSCEPGFLQESM